ncbi:MAG: efflux RND transporter permease subunit [Pseudomonadota bacterium]
MRPGDRLGGPIAWMAKNSVAANLLMAVLIAGGIYMMLFIVKQEYLPSVEPDTVTVTVASPGATPADIEQSIVLVLENAISALDNIEKVTGTASEGSGSLSLELGIDKDVQATFNDIQSAIDGITTFPEDAEEPSVALSIRRRPVVDVMLYGDTDDMSMRMAAEHLRTALLRSDGISRVDIQNERDLEIRIEISESLLRSYDLTLGEIAETVRQTALDRSGGTIETDGGDLLLRMADRREELAEFAKIPILSDPRGTVLRLGDIGTISRSFGDSEKSFIFNGYPARELKVYRAGRETPIGVSEAVRAALPDAMRTLPAALDVIVLNDRSEYFKGRKELLLTNGFVGLSLVLLLLSLFLNVRLAFWVAVGIPTAFMGAMLVLPSTGMTINLVSMFAFIVALGLVVDDAIVVGENIFDYRQKGMPYLEAAVRGAQDIAVPLTFSILTNIVAFIPLALTGGWLGKLFFAIPVVVSLAFIMSWIEALFVLPAHLAHDERKKVRLYPPISWIAVALSMIERKIFGPVQRAFAGGLDWVTHTLYGPLMRFAAHGRYVTVAICFAIFAIALAYVMSGRMGFGLFPPVPRDYAKASITMPVGTPTEITLAARDTVVASALRVVRENGGDDLSLGVDAHVDGTSVRVHVHLTPPKVRPLETREFVSEWREATGVLPSARSLQFESSWGGPGGSSLEIRLSHPDTDTLAQAAARLASDLAQFGPVRDTRDGFSPGKEQLEFTLSEAGRALGLSSAEVASQVRAAFYGAEVLRQQDGRNEITVRVLRPESERRSEADIETLLVRTPDGGHVPLFEVANVVNSRADATITREENQRVVSVTANVEPRKETTQVIAAAQADLLPQLSEDYPGLSYSLEGRQATRRDAMKDLIYYSAISLIIIYGLLAVPFKSYFQPIIICLTIPFGFVGAVLGHLIMGYALSLISIFGIVALSGVLINAGIVMIDYANKRRLEGVGAYDAICGAGVRRFRPILLTTITTFCGLAPMIFETSRQAQFLIPMAISLGYGIVFATLVVLFLIPALYLVLEDIKSLINPDRDYTAPEDLEQSPDATVPVPAE